MTKLKEITNLFGHNLEFEINAKDNSEAVAQVKLIREVIGVEGAWSFIDRGWDRSHFYLHITNAVTYSWNPAPVDLYKRVSLKVLDTLICEKEILKIKREIWGW